MNSNPTRMCRVLALLIVFAHSAVTAEEIQWQLEAEGRVIGKPTITENRIYIAAGQTVLALSLAGDELWRRDLAGGVAA